MENLRETLGQSDTWRDGFLAGIWVSFASMAVLLFIVALVLR